MQNGKVLVALSVVENGMMNGRPKALSMIGIDLHMAKVIQQRPIKIRRGQCQLQR
jgi:hypothetical protein